VEGVYFNIMQVSNDFRSHDFDKQMRKRWEYSGSNDNFRFPLPFLLFLVDCRVVYEAR